VNYKLKAKELAALIKKQPPVPQEIKRFLSEIQPPHKAVRVALLVVQHHGVPINSLHELVRN